MKMYFLSMQSLMGAGYFWEALLKVVIQGSKILLSCSSILKSLSLPAVKMGLKGIEGWGTWRSPVCSEWDAYHYRTPAPFSSQVSV